MCFAIGGTEVVDMRRRSSLKVLVVSLLVAACAPTHRAGVEGVSTVQRIDERSYQLGVIGAFAEVVSLGVKKLALSSAMDPREMDAVIEEAQRIAEKNGVEIYREDDFLVTDLFPETVTEGKHVLLIYRGSTKDEYLALKAEKRALEERGAYTGEARKEIARKMGRLLSYPESRIEEMLQKREPAYPPSAALTVTMAAALACRSRRASLRAAATSGSSNTAQPAPNVA
jgi:hypothetical protein